MAGLTTPARSMDDPRPCLGRELQSRVFCHAFILAELPETMWGFAWRRADSHCEGFVGRLRCESDHTGPASFSSAGYASVVLSRVGYSEVVGDSGSKFSHGVVDN